MQKTYKATIKAHTLGRIETWKNDKNSYWMQQILYIGKQRFTCSLAYIDYRWDHEFMVFDDYWEVFCRENIKDFTKDILKDYMQEFTLRYIQNALN